MQRLLILASLFSIAALVSAGEIQSARVDHQKGEYNLDLSVKVNGNRDRIYTILTDHDLLPTLSDVIIKSETLPTAEGSHPDTVRHRLITRVCVLVFCFNTTTVEDMLISDTGTIQTTFVPELSDFVYGESEWQVVAVDDSQTMINYRSKFRPDFWIPPLIGPPVVKRTMLKTATQIINNIESIAALDPVRP
jgi:hypothetical protein